MSRAAFYSASLHYSFCVHCFPNQFAHCISTPKQPASPHDQEMDRDQLLALVDEWLLFDRVRIFSFFCLFLSSFS